MNSPNLKKPSELKFGLIHFGPLRDRTHRVRTAPRFTLDRRRGLFEGEKLLVRRGLLLKLLRALLANPDEVLSKDWLGQNVWVGEELPSDESIDRAVSDLRHLLHDNAKKPIYVATERDEGIRFIGTIFDQSGETGNQKEMEIGERHEELTTKSDQFQRALRAWREVEFAMINQFLVDYYQARGVPLFLYPSATGSSTAVPLYVRPAWQNLTEATLIRTQNSKREEVRLPAYEHAFFEQYQEIRKQLGLLPMWNGELFRLVSLEPRDPALHLSFEYGRFFDAVACQYALEHEVRLALAPHFKLRDSVSTSYGSYRRSPRFW